MSAEEFKCFLCGKKARGDKIKKNISFYIKWIDYVPGKWMCRECKENIHDKNLGRYKLQMIFGDPLLPK
ncbi:MAG: hypothetical protein HWN66_11190 [Candidatus Helarchaeota archaeon]|nr:hypothetical protein [Candidatus Helarchaeota archaeon]